MSLKEIEKEILSCRRCPLWKSKKNYVPGEGNENAEIIFIGEAPGRDEDEKGRPFVGNAGKLLTDLIENTLQLRREDVFITNVLKCRPPNNRDPTEEEIKACLPYLLKQIEAINPKVIVCLGRFAAKTVFEHFGLPFTTISKERGIIREKNGKYLIATYHPAAGLYKPPLKEVIEKDFRKIRDLIKKTKKKKVTLFDFFSK